MDRRRSTLCTLSCWVFVLGSLLLALESDAATLTAMQAKDHVGETATVCGRVASATQEGPCDRRLQFEAMVQ
jgi:hypothetical protein